MPLYEYECDACGHRFEIIRKFSDPPVDRCPKCGGLVHKLQSAPAFHLKGSGWYITDYGRKESGSGANSKGDSASGEKGDSASGEKGDSASGETKSDTTKTTESKPESKTETKTSTPASDKPTS